MKNTIKELTEGMQRLCAVANRVVAKEGEVSRIEVDLLQEDLRRLYDVALELAERVAAPRSNAPLAGGARTAPSLADHDMHSSTVMATKAAMSVAPLASAPEAAPSAPAPSHAPESPAQEIAPTIPAPAPEPLPLMEDLEANGNSLLFDEVPSELINTS